MDQESLVTEQIEAGSRFLGEFDKYAPVRVAFWLREQDERFWYLYVASDGINDENFDLAYAEVVRLANQMQDPDFDPFRVKVLGSAEPLAKAVLEVRERYRGAKPIRLRDTYLGGVVAEEVYVYPSPLTASVA